MLVASPVFQQGPGWICPSALLYLFKKTKSLLKGVWVEEQNHATFAKSQTEHPFVRGRAGLPPPPGPSCSQNGDSEGAAKPEAPSGRGGGA